MGKSTIVWVADDGTSFSTEREMLLHELSKVDTEEIDIFIDGYTQTPKLKTQYKKVLLAWQKYQRESSSSPQVLPIQETEEVAELFEQFKQGEQWEPPGGYLLGDLDREESEEDEDLRRSFEKATAI
jgi:hypothetical protein